MTSDRTRAVAATALLAALVGYVLLTLYVATTGDPVAAVVADVALAVGAVGYGLALFVRGPVADGVAVALFAAGFVRLLALVSADPGYRLGAELLLAAAAALLLARWLRRRAAAAASDGADGESGRGRGRGRGRAS